jgi:hypothetical protein
LLACNKKGTMHKEEGRKDVIDVLKKLWLVYKLREPVMHICIWHQYSLMSSLRYLICI